MFCGSQLQAGHAKPRNHIDLDLFALHVECLIKRRQKSMNKKHGNTDDAHVCLSAGLSTPDGLTIWPGSGPKAKRRKAP